ncbi:MAG: hypothetical protein BGO10_10025 [Chlamydia sp. 32-24]|nr:MAG: hypothetical protein BGO10_10025 [Chlamydia sp. 32-24]
MDAPSCELFGFKDHFYYFHALRTIGTAPLGSADIAECWRAIQNIEEGNDESWHKAWHDLAQKVEINGNEYLQKKHLLSASNAFARASNYYRAAEFLLHTNKEDPRILTTWKKSKDCFRNYLKYGSGYKVEEFAIPFENTTLPAYLGFVDDKPRPLIIAQTGYDGTSEELFFVLGKAALERGFHILIFEGPGQGAVIREQHIPFRSNWETVITPVIDSIYNHPLVDNQKIILMGISMGGYLVPRALAFENRVALSVVNGGVYDFHEIFMRDTPPDLETWLDSPEICEEIDKFLYIEMQKRSEIRWAISHGMYVFHVPTPSALFRVTRDYHLRDVIKEIKTKMLVVDSENDLLMKDQGKKFYTTLQAPKDYLFFTTQEGAGEHCQIGASQLSNEKIFNWIEENI